MSRFDSPRRSALTADLIATLTGPPSNLLLFHDVREQADWLDAWGLFQSLKKRVGQNS